MYPDRNTAARELEIAGRMNPGPWTAHSENAARAAACIAAGCGLDAERAYVSGLLHDIGRRTGISQLRHAIDGYDFAMEKGWDEIARICITHSFPVRDIRADIGRADVTPAQYAFIDQYLRSIEYDDYDRLIMVCDGLAEAGGLCILDKRFVDTARRYGVHACTLDRWNRTLEYKAHFDALAGASIYTLLPGIEACIYRTTD